MSPLPDHNQPDIWQHLLQPSKHPLHLNHVPAGRGIGWFQDALRTFFRQPFAMFALTSTCILTWMLCALIPHIGTGLGLMLVPGITLGYLLAAMAVRAGFRAQLPLLFLPFVFGFRHEKPLLRALLIIGVLYALGNLLVLYLLENSTRESMQILHDMQQSGQTSVQDMMAFHQSHPEVARASALAMLCNTLITVMLLHVPALCFWGKLNPFKATVFNLMGIARNLPAYMLCGAALGCATLLCTMLTVIITPLLMIPLLFALTGVSMCSTAHAFVDTFCTPVTRPTNTAATPASTSNSENTSGL